MEDRFLRRKDAAEYLTTKYGFGAERTLAKGAVTGDSPAYHKAGRIVLYTREALDAWALAKIGGPISSTSESPKAA
jgi:glycine betaine/choline ABC-type transport system substrate-binding protein